MGAKLTSLPTCLDGQHISCFSPSGDNVPSAFDFLWTHLCINLRFIFLRKRRIQSKLNHFGVKDSSQIIPQLNTQLPAKHRADAIKAPSVVSNSSSRGFLDSDGQWLHHAGQPGPVILKRNNPNPVDRCAVGLSFTTKLCVNHRRRMYNFSFIQNPLLHSTKREPPVFYFRHVTRALHILSSPYIPFRHSPSASISSDKIT